MPVADAPSCCLPAHHCRCHHLHTRTDTGLAECTQLSNLRQLALKPHSSLADGSMMAVSRLTQLRSLALCLPSYSQPLLDGVKRLASLRVRAATHSQQMLVKCARPAVSAQYLPHMFT
jgi:hypothetical protein